MGTTRRFNLILGAVLALATIVALQTYGISSVAAQSSQPYTGMGEWRRFEVQQTEAPAVVGMGDLRRIEVQAPIIPVTGGSGSSLPITGMGDLRRFELQQASSLLNIGMGNLRLIEGQQSNLNNTTPQNSLPVTIIDISRSNHTDKLSVPAGPTPKGPGR